jgi:hypothetical protein
MQEELRDWLVGRLPDDWFTEAPDVRGDRDEVLVVGRIPEPDPSTEAARRGRIQRFREDTRERRMRIADEFERRFGGKVSWGATCGDLTVLFTTLNVPVMTRLRLDERIVLDTLVDAGVARSRSEALAWCVRLVGQHQGDWIRQLRDALVQVENVRAAGPAA